MASVVSIKTVSGIKVSSKMVSLMETDLNAPLESTVTEHSKMAPLLILSILNKDH